MVAQDGWTPAAGVSQLDVWHSLVTIDIHIPLDVTHRYDSRWCFIRLCPFYFWQPPFFPQVPLGRLTSYGCLREEWYVDGERGRGYDYLPSCEAIDCVAQMFFSGWMAKPEGKLFQSTLLPPIGPPFPSSFRCKYFIHLYVFGWMWFDEFENLKMATTTKKKKSALFFWCQVLGCLVSDSSVCDKTRLELGENCSVPCDQGSVLSCSTPGLVLKFLNTLDRNVGQYHTSSCSQ